MNTEKIRQDFPFLKQKIDGKPVIYFDNAATTLKPRKVIDAITGYYENYSVNVHRAFYRLGERATMEYDEAHEKTAKFAHNYGVLHKSVVLIDPFEITGDKRSFLKHNRKAYEYAFSFKDTSNDCPLLFK